MVYSKIGLIRGKGPVILALGAQSKVSFCFIKGPDAYLARPEWDLDNPEDLKKFRKEINRLKIRPDIVACDLHPDYTTTKLSYEIAGYFGSDLKKIQHHKAHIASCLADNAIKGPVIGIAFDGTGFGTDGNVWGGDFFIGGLKGFKRIAHLKYIAMPGGEAAIKEPWRMAFSYLYGIFGEKVNSLKLEFLRDKDTGLLSQIIRKKINSPLASSMGRLFDSVAAIIGICDTAEHEGQAAIMLEREIRECTNARFYKNKYDFSYKDKNGIIEIDWAPVIERVALDVRDKKNKSEISLKFHNALIYMIGEVCGSVRKKYKIKKVCVSGGVFQNKYLSGNIKPFLLERGFEVYTHKMLPAHDGNIALGQAVMAMR